MIMNVSSNLTVFPSTQISINGAAIHHDRHGRFCLNDLHQASGGERKNQPQYFLDNVKTKDLVQELIDTGIPVSPVEVVRGGLNQGTYVVKQIVYAYAMWISAKFHLKVINSFDALINHRQQIPQSFAAALQLAADQAKKIELDKPKVDYYDKIVVRDTLLNATQVAQKIGLSAITMNKLLDSFNVYSHGVKRARVFQQWFVDKGFGELKQTDLGYSQPMFTTKGEAWVIEKLVSEGAIS
jgi:phage antirepressor YoqD-like protein